MNAIRVEDDGVVETGTGEQRGVPAGECLELSGGARLVDGGGLMRIETAARQLACDGLECLVDGARERARVDGAAGEDIDHVRRDAAALVERCDGARDVRGERGHIARAYSGPDNSERQLWSVYDESCAWGHARAHIALRISTAVEHDRVRAAKNHGRPSIECASPPSITLRRTA